MCLRCPRGRFADSESNSGAAHAAARCLCIASAVGYGVRPALGHLLGRTGGADWSDGRGAPSCRDAEWVVGSVIGRAVSRRPAGSGNDRRKSAVDQKRQVSSAANSRTWASARPEEAVSRGSRPALRVPASILPADLPRSFKSQDASSPCPRRSPCQPPLCVCPPPDHKAQDPQPTVGLLTGCAMSTITMLHRLSLVLAFFSFSSSVIALPHSHPPAQRSLPGRWYQPDDHPVRALFRRDVTSDGVPYATVGSDGTFRS